MKKQLILMSIISLLSIKNINAYEESKINRSAKTESQPISQADYIELMVKKYGTNWQEDMLKEQELEKKYYAQEYARQMEKIYGKNWQASIALAKNTKPSYHNPKKSGVVQLSPEQQVYMDQWYTYANEMEKKYGTNWFRIMEEKHIPMMQPPMMPE